MKIIDIKALSLICKKDTEQDILFVVDNTFASPVFQLPLVLGADLVMHSTTKYIGGHSDLVGGALMTNNSYLHERLKFVQFAAGAVSGPIECFLLLRSIKTLALRMQQHHHNGLLVARFLEQHPLVEDLIHPGLASHPQHSLAQKQMTGYSGMLSFRLKGGIKQVSKFCENLNLIELAESLGGVESLINHPEAMTHASVPKPMREKLGIGENLLRLSVGIESSDDLIQDLEQALASV
jgi:cystathionine beta-lyase/cystathionine gamma-synthase